MNRLDRALGVMVEVVKTDVGREALGTLALAVVGMLVGRRCSHPYSSLVWVDENRAVCRRCGKVVQREGG